MDAVPGDRFDADFAAFDELLDERLLGQRLAQRPFHCGRDVGRVQHLGDPAAARAVGRLDDDGRSKVATGRVGRRRHEHESRTRQTARRKRLAHQMLVGRARRDVERIAHQPQAVGNVVDRHGGQIRGDGGDALRTDLASFRHDRFLFHDGNGIEAIAQFPADGALLPGEHMGFDAHLPGFENERHLKVTGADNQELRFHRRWFRSSPVSNRT